MDIQRSWRRKGLDLMAMFFALLLLVACGESEVAAPQSGPIDPAMVQKLYSAKCGICHGQDGKGVVDNAKDLTASILRRDEVLDRIRYGVSTMPPHKDILSEDQIQALADYAIGLRGAAGQ
ncbi:MAG: putative cytochrome c variant [Bacteroidota bacterium]